MLILKYGLFTLPVSKDASFPGWFLVSALTILKSDQEYANKTELGYILLPFYFTSHNHFLLWEQAQDCTPLITYQDKKSLNARGFFSPLAFFDI